MPHIPALLADIDFGGLVTVVILLISFIGWISNLASGQQKGNAPKAAPKEPVRRNEQLQREIDTFLKEATGQRRGQRQNRPAERVLSTDDVEVLPPRQKAPIQRPAPPVKSQKKPKKKEKEKTFASSLSTSRQSSLPSSSGGQGGGQRQMPVVDQRSQLPIRVPFKSGSPTSTTPTSNIFSRSLSAADSAPFGTLLEESSLGRRLENETTRRAERPADQLIQLLKSPASLKQAILLQEILGSRRGMQRR